MRQRERKRKREERREKRVEGEGEEERKGGRGTLDRVSTVSPTAMHVPNKRRHHPSNISELWIPHLFDSVY